MTDDERLPDGMTCRHCGYSVGGLPMGRCPECGFEVGPHEVVLHRRMLTVEEDWPRLRRARVRLYLVVIPLYALGAGVLGWHWGVLVSSLVAMTALVGASCGAGWLATRLARPTERTVLFSLWVRCLPILHGPWLVMPLCAAIAFVIAVVDSIVETNGALLMGVSVLGLFLWVFGCFACLVVWADRWGRAAETLHLSLGGWCGTAVVAFMLMTLAASALLGLAGGILAAGGVASHVFP